jgi:hypothetical protein
VQRAAHKSTDGEVEMSAIPEPEAYEMRFIVEAPHGVAAALFEQVRDLLCNCTDEKNRCVYCGEEHPRDGDDMQVACAAMKSCRNPLGAMHPVEPDEGRLHG